MLIRFNFSWPFFSNALPVCTEEKLVEIIVLLKTCLVVILDNFNIIKKGKRIKKIDLKTIKKVSKKYIEQKMWIISN